MPLFIYLITLSTPALAYVGPGPGLSMMGSLYTLVAGVAIALFFVIFYPIRMLIKNKKKKQDNEEA